VTGEEPARWCEHTTAAGQPCERLAVVLVTDFAGLTAYVCRDHWHHLNRTTGGQVRAVQIVHRHHKPGGDHR
jgi:hypothetical protein